MGKYQYLIYVIIAIFFSEIIKPSSRAINQEEGALTAMDEDYQALTSKEESDLEALMSDTQAAISNAENFAEHLSKQLSVLDGVSISGSLDKISAFDKGTTVIVILMSLVLLFISKIVLLYNL